MVGLMGMESDITLAKNNHTKYLCRFDIDAPQIDMEKYKKFVQVGYLYKSLAETQQFPFTILKCKPIEMKKVYDRLKINYEIEKGDLIHYNDPDEIYILCIRKLEKKLTLTENWVAIGIVERYDWVIQFAWVHPSVRKKGIFSNFILYYATKIGPVFLQPPISLEMQKICNYLNKSVLGSDKFLEIYSKNILRFFNEKLKLDKLSQLTPVEILKLMESFSNLSMCLGGERKLPDTDENKNKIMQLAIDTLLYFRDNPEFKEKLEMEMENSGALDGIRKMKENFCKTGLFHGT